MTQEQEPKPEHPIELSSFLYEVRDRFLNGQALDVEQVVPEMAKTMTPNQLKDLVVMTNEHFKMVICKHCNIVNDPFEGTEVIDAETMRVTPYDLGHFTPKADPEYVWPEQDRRVLKETPIVDIEIAANNAADFLFAEGSNSLRSHLKHRLGSREWEELEAESQKRYLIDAEIKGDIK